MGAKPWFGIFLWLIFFLAKEGHDRMPSKYANGSGWGGAIGYGGSMCELYKIMYIV